MVATKLMINHKSSMNNSRGVTLIEVLVVTAIMFILLGISFVGYRERGEELKLQRVAFKVAADIERVRGMAMSAQEEEISGEIPEGGWGICFDTANPNQYILFADLDADKFRKIDASENVETIYLEDGIEIDGLLPSTPLDVVFSPPSPDVYLQGGLPLNEVNIIIALINNPLKRKTIIVNSAGLVSISN